MKLNGEQLKKLGEINKLKKIERYFRMKEFIEDELQKVVDDYSGQIKEIYGE
jgi:hypothetical protein